MDITIKIEAPQLADAINALAVAIAGNIELILDGPGARAAQTTIAAAVPTAPTTVTPAPAVPVTPQPVVQAEQPQATVPTTQQTYTMEQLAVAATQLVDAGRREELVGLLGQFGVQALTALPKEQYGAFATALRQMGAKI